MQEVFHRKVTVLPGGKVEVVNAELETGQTVDVVVLHEPRSARRSAVDILAEAPGHRLFKTGKEVDDYIRQERASWDR